MMSPKDPQESSLPGLSPYPLVLVEDVSDNRTDYANDIIYEFTRDSQVEYRLAFKPDGSYLPDEKPLTTLVYSFILTRLGEKASVNDSRIKATVIYALKTALAYDPNLVITYQCSAKDNQEKVRARMFRQWFNECGTQYKHIDSPASSEIFATAIYQKDNPLGNQIRQTFSRIFDNK